MGPPTDTADDKPGRVPGLPTPASVYVQLGFAGLVAVLFPLLIYRADQRAVEDRQLFREQAVANDRRFEKLAEKIDANTDVTRRAIERLDDAHRAIRRDVETLKQDGPSAYVAPTPREKP